MLLCKVCSEETDGEVSDQPAVALAPQRVQDGEAVTWKPVCQVCADHWFDESDPANPETGFTLVPLSTGLICEFTCECGQSRPVDLDVWENSGEVICPKCHQLMSLDLSGSNLILHKGETYEFNR